MGRIADDNFAVDGPPRARWRQFQANLLASGWSCSDGVMRATMTVAGSGNGLWFTTGTVPLLYQLVRGDIDVIAECRVFRATFSGLPANTAASLLGHAFHDRSMQPTFYGLHRR